MMAHSPWGGARVLTLSPSQLLPLLGPKFGSRGQYFRLARACLLSWAPHCCATPACPQSLPSQYGEAHLHSCEPVVSKAKLSVWSVLRQWDLRPLPAQPGARPMMYRTSDTWTSSSPQSPLFLQAARPCTVSNTTETSVSVLCWVWGHKQALRVWGKAVL